MPIDEKWKEAFRRVRLAHTNDEIENMTNEELAHAVQKELQRMDVTPADKSVPDQVASQTGQDCAGV